MNILGPLQHKYFYFYFFVWVLEKQWHKLSFPNGTPKQSCKLLRTWFSSSKEQLHPLTGAARSWDQQILLKNLSALTHFFLSLLKFTEMHPKELHGRESPYVSPHIMSLLLGDTVTLNMQLQTAGWQHLPLLGSLFPLPLGEKIKINIYIYKKNNLQQCLHLSLYLWEPFLPHGFPQLMPLTPSYWNLLSVTSFLCD